jgi:FixJ family two-component response regulator
VTSIEDIQYPFSERRRGFGNGAFRPHPAGTQMAGRLPGDTHDGNFGRQTAKRADRRRPRKGWPGGRQGGAMIAAHVKPEPALILIVDDDEEVRTALRELILSVGLEAACFASTRELLAAQLPDRPGCMVLDVRMPGSSGLDLQQQLVANGNVKPIIFLTGHADVPMTVQAMKAGAIDFLTKPVRDQALLDAIGIGVERDVARQAAARAVKQQIARFRTLTARERQVMAKVAKGRLNKQIAFELGISEITVKLHRGNMMRKMEASSLGNLVRAWECLPAELRDDTA